MSQSSTDQVVALLRTANLNRANRAAIAKQLQISTSDLSHRLAGEQTRLTTLVRAERKCRVDELLAVNPHADLALIARKCNLSHVSEASKLFKKCFGTTLRAYKKGRTR